MSTAHFYHKNQDMSDGPCIEDLVLAAEIGKSLLERNRDLEYQLKMANQTTASQTRDINMLNCEVSSLQLTNESQLRIYEEVDRSAHSSENKCRQLQTSLTAATRDKDKLTDTIKNMENEILDHRATIERLKLNHQGTLLKSGGEKQIFTEAQEASKRREQSLMTAQHALTSKLAACRRDLEASESSLTTLSSSCSRLTIDLDSCQVRERDARLRLVAGEHALQAVVAELESLRVVGGGGAPGEGGGAYDADNVSVLGELLQLKRDDAAGMCSTFPAPSVDHQHHQLHLLDDCRDGDSGTRAIDCVSSPPEYKRLFEEIFRTLRQRPLTAHCPTYDEYDLPRCSK